MNLRSIEPISVIVLGELALWDAVMDLSQIPSPQGTLTATRFPMIATTVRTIPNPISSTLMATMTAMAMESVMSVMSSCGWLRSPGPASVWATVIHHMGSFHDGCVGDSPTPHSGPA